MLFYEIFPTRLQECSLQTAYPKIFLPLCHTPNHTPNPLPATHLPPSLPHIYPLPCHTFNPPHLTLPCHTLNPPHLTLPCHALNPPHLTIPCHTPNPLPATPNPLHLHATPQPSLPHTQPSLPHAYPPAYMPHRCISGTSMAVVGVLKGRLGTVVRGGG